MQSSLRAFLATAALALALVPTAVAASTTLVISQVYGGGGNSGATFKNDFIEILNISASPVSLNGFSVQYASSGGAFSNITPLPNESLQPGQYFLIGEAAGAGGTTNLPTPDVTGSINMSATSGKVALVSSTSSLASCTAASVVDLVGYGPGVSCSETSPTAVLSNTTAALRIAGGCTDTDNNSTDFTVGAPNPRNTSTIPNACSAGPSPLTITTSILPAATVNNVYSVTLAATGGSGTKAWTSTALPAGLLLNSSTGVLSGTPTSTDSTSITFTVTDTTGSANAMLTLAVNPVPPCNSMPIGAVQGGGDTSPLAGQSVTIQGIVTALRTNGFFVQDSGDGNDATSDGIFVFTSSAPSGNAIAGNSACVSGLAAEFDGQTEIDAPLVLCHIERQPVAGAARADHVGSQSRRPYRSAGKVLRHACDHPQPRRFRTNRRHGR